MATRCEPGQALHVEGRYRLPANFAHLIAEVLYCVLVHVRVALETAAANTKGLLICLIVFLLLFVAGDVIGDLARWENLLNLAEVPLGDPHMLDLLSTAFDMSVLAVGSHEAEALPVVVALAIHDEGVVPAVAASALTSKATTVSTVVVALIARTVPTSTFTTSVILLLLLSLRLRLLIRVVMVTVCRCRRIWIALNIVDWGDGLSNTAQTEVGR